MCPDLAGGQLNWTQLADLGSELWICSRCPTELSSLLDWQASEHVFMAMAETQEEIRRHGSSLCLQVSVKITLAKAIYVDKPTQYQWDRKYTLPLVVGALEKTLMLGKTEGRRRSGQRRMRWLDGITNSMDMSLS